MKGPDLSPAARFLLVMVAMTTTKDIVPSWRASDGSTRQTAMVLLDALGSSVSPRREILSVAEEVATSGYVECDFRGQVRVLGLPDSMPTENWREARDMIQMSPV